MKGKTRKTVKRVKNKTNRAFKKKKKKKKKNMEGGKNTSNEESSKYTNHDSLITKTSYETELPLHHQSKHEGRNVATGCVFNTKAADSGVLFSMIHN